MNDRFISPNTPPEGLARELLVVLSEELHEVCEQVAWIFDIALTAGLQGPFPDEALPRTKLLKTSLSKLTSEIGDVLAVVDRLKALNLLRQDDIMAGWLEQQGVLSCNSRFTDLQLTAAEAGKRACKSLRFGLSEVQPGQPYSNAARLGRLIGNFRHTVDVLQENEFLDWDAVMKAHAKKQEKLDLFLQSQN